jgi:hypothetical protein
MRYGSSKQVKKGGIYKEDEDWIRVVSPYIPDLVEEIKITFPSSERKWEPTKKCWLVRSTYLQQVAEILNRYLDEIETDLNEPVKKTAITNEPYSVLGLLSSVDSEVITKVYMILATKYHPDKNPNNVDAAEQMKRINVAYATIKKERNLP